MNTKYLVDTLVKDCRRVNPLPPVTARVWRWVLAGFAFTVVMLGTLGLRPELWEMLTTFTFVSQVVLLLLAAISAAASALTLAIPGAEQQSTRVFPVVLLLLWIALMLSVLLLSDLSTATENITLDSELSCSSMLILVALFPAALLFYMVARGAPLRKAWAGLFASLAGASLAALTLQLHCPHQSPLHYLISHGLPIVVFTLCGLGVAHLVFRWDKRT